MEGDVCVVVLAEFFVRRIKINKFILILTLVLLFPVACSSARIVNEQDLSYFAKGIYMGSKDGFHHFQIPELETVFYEHVKIPIQEYRVEHEMPYALDEAKWQTVILRPNFYIILGQSNFCTNCIDGIVLGILYSSKND